ncbi:hypothetical protein ACFVU0_34540 [Streptomyces sp. NPDC058122]|uniref:hypothetical protein n=1 Tax=Streptomyces sp. NPDC058122 TaxID=3346349 RepID=UPI0036EE0E1D
MEKSNARALKQTSFWAYEGSGTGESGVHWHPTTALATVSGMKSRIVGIARWGAPRAQHGDSVCSAHGTRTCSRDLVADVVLRDAGSPRIRWTVCRHWLDHEPDVAAYEAGPEGSRQ